MCAYVYYVCLCTFCIFRLLCAYVYHVLCILSHVLEVDLLVGRKERVFGSVIQSGATTKPQPRNPKTFA